jgi:hypothetical protein
LGTKAQDLNAASAQNKTDFLIRDLSYRQRYRKFDNSTRARNYGRSEEEASRDVARAIKLREFGLSTTEIDVYRIDDHANY